MKKSLTGINRRIRVLGAVLLGLLVLSLAGASYGAALQYDTLLSSALRQPGTFNSGVFFVPSVPVAPPGSGLGATAPAKGVHVFINTSQVGSSSLGLVVTLQQRDPGSGLWASEPGAATASISAIGTTDIIVHPSAVGVTNRRVQDAGFGQSGYRVQAVVTTTNCTFSVGAVYIP